MLFRLELNSEQIRMSLAITCKIASHYIFVAAAANSSAGDMAEQDGKTQKPFDLELFDRTFPELLVRLAKHSI
jgi:hypothetical protein